jgi:hypothetical protein
LARKELAHFLGRGVLKVRAQQPGFDVRFEQITPQLRVVRGKLVIVAARTRPRGKENSPCVCVRAAPPVSRAVNAGAVNASAVNAGAVNASASISLRSIGVIVFFLTKPMMELV